MTPSWPGGVRERGGGKGGGLVLGRSNGFHVIFSLFIFAIWFSPFGEYWAYFPGANGEIIQGCPWCPWMDRLGDWMLGLSDKPIALEDIEYLHGVKMGTVVPVLWGHVPIF